MILFRDIVRKKASSALSSNIIGIRKVRRKEEIQSYRTEILHLILY